MKSFFLWLFIFLTAISCCSAVLRKDIAVKGNYITLGDLFEDIPAKYRDSKITSTALPGQQKRVNAAYVNQILAGFDLPVMDLDNITYIDVMTFSHEIKASELSEFISRNYNISYPVLSDYDVKYISTDKYVIRMDRLGKERFIVEIIDQEENILKKFVIRFIERIKRTVLVSTREIKSGEILLPEYFSFMEMLMPVTTSELIDNIDKIKHCSSSRDMSPGTVLLKENINYAEIVIKGNIVEAVNRGEGFSVTLKLEAMQSGKYNQIINLKGINNRRKYRGRVTDENKVDLIF